MSNNRLYSFRNTANWMQNMPFVAVEHGRNNIAIPMNNVEIPNHVVIPMNHQNTYENSIRLSASLNNEEGNNLTAENVTNLRKVNINTPNWNIAVGNNRSKESIPANLLPNGPKTRRRRRSQRKQRRTARR